MLTLVQEPEWEDIPILEGLGIEVIAEPFSPLERPGRWRNRLGSWFQLLFDPWPHYGRTYALDGLQKQLTLLLKAQQFDIVQLEHLFAARARE